jgi:hypothetical protein
VPATCVSLETETLCPVADYVPFPAPAECDLSLQVDFAAEFAAWRRLFAYADLTPMPSAVFPETASITSFEDLIKFATAYVARESSKIGCQEYAAAHIKKGGGINYSLAAEHMRQMEVLGVTEACAAVQRQHSGSYLQPRVVEEEYASFKEFASLLDLAANGASILRPADFAPNNGVGCRSRSNAVAMADAVIARLAQEQATGDVMIVPAAEFRALAHLRGLEFNVTELGWTFKHGNKDSDQLGRVTDDATNSPSPLNTPASLLMAEARYGSLVLPQLHDMCQSLLQARVAFPGKPIAGLKEDVSRAYRRVRFRPDHCPLMTCIMPLDHNGVEHYAIRLSQPFGHNASAHAWGVVARGIHWHIGQHDPRQLAPQLSDIYVDDFYSFGEDLYLHEVSGLFTDACRVAGSDARDPLKAEISTRLQSLGWMFLDEFDSIMPNSKGWYNLIALFFTDTPWVLNKQSTLPVKLLQRLGSYASRYSQVFPALRPFYHSFYGNTKGASPLARRHVSARTIQDIWMWRMFLALAFYQPYMVSAPIHWPVRIHSAVEDQAASADYIVYVDAATSSDHCGAYIAGVAWCLFQSPVQSFWLGNKCHVLDINLRELTGVIVGAIMAIVFAPPGTTHIHLWCDNSSSVAWADTNRTVSPIASLLLQILTFLGTSRRILFTVGWIAGKQNIVADAISRCFRVLGGEAIKEQLDKECVLFLAPTTLSETMIRASKMSQAETLVLARDARIVLDSLNTTSSPPTSA